MLGVPGSGRGKGGTTWKKIFSLIYSRTVETRPKNFDRRCMARWAGQSSRKFITCRYFMQIGINTHKAGSWILEARFTERDIL